MYQFVAMRLQELLGAVAFDVGVRDIEVETQGWMFLEHHPNGFGVVQVVGDVFDCHDDAMWCGVLSQLRERFGVPAHRIVVGERM